MATIPVIDIFAGPGGLSEGFSSVRTPDGKPYYNISLSVEKDIYAYQTLLLRSFFRQFPDGEAPDEYYELLQGRLSLKDLYSVSAIKYKSELNNAMENVLHAALGSGPDIDESLDLKISRLTENVDKWVLIGGPPCQAYSIIGRARNTGRETHTPENDERTLLYKEYLKILAKHKPAVFIMENVKGILSSKLNGQSIINRIINDLKNPSDIVREFGETSYRIFSLVKGVGDNGLIFQDLKPVDFVIECENYGIPQTRHRVILLGIRDDLYYRPPGILGKNNELYKVEDVIKDLPQIRSGLSRENDTGFNWRRRIIHAGSMRWLRTARRIAGEEVYQDILNTLRSLKIPENNRGDEFVPCEFDTDGPLSWWYIDQRIGGACNHYSKAHMVKDLYRYLYVSCFGKVKGLSPKLKQFPKDLVPDHANAGTGDFADRFRVQIWNRPSTTITSHLSKDGHYFIHPDPQQCRSFTVREAARLQTFPDNYYFYGGRRQQYAQVGNAVPPLLAKSIAEIIRDYLENIND